MRVLFVRHASALKADEFNGSDLDRPLKKEAEKKAKKIFTLYKKIYKEIDLIVTSKAVRSKESAKILSAVFDGAKIKEYELLNPGCDYESFKKVLNSLDSSISTVVVVGHEPDLSAIISSCVTGSGVLYLNIKKLALVEIEMGREAKGELISFLLPKQLKSVSKHSEK